MTAMSVTQIPSFLTINVLAILTAQWLHCLAIFLINLITLVLKSRFSQRVHDGHVRDTDYFFFDDKSTGNSYGSVAPLFGDFSDDKSDNFGLKIAVLIA